jgi:3-oxoacyl-[acyl-carrier-protein] synthase I
MKVYLNALGLVTSIGRGKDDVARNLFKGTRAGLIERTDLLSHRAARVGMVQWKLPELPDHLSHYECRNNRLALDASDQIMEAVKDTIDRVGSSRIAVVMGTSTSGIAEGEEALASRLKNGAWPEGFRYSRQEVGNLASFVAAYCGVTGPAYTITTACSSSAKALASAQRLIATGLCDAALAGGSDSLCKMTIHGFDSLEALAADYCNPFSRNRDGINIGEGAAVFLMSRQPSPVALLGAGESSDACHVSAPDPEGIGAALAMSRALEHSGLTPGDIDYINLHGTATPLNDAMEARAVAAIFGDRIPCSSTKPMTGHTLGAAGAIEAAFLWLMLEPQFSAGLIPPHLWDGAADPELPGINLASAGYRIGLSERCAALSNSFAFGGSNASVILGRGW